MAEFKVVDYDRREDNSFTCKECGARVDDVLTHSKWHHGIRDLLEKLAVLTSSLVSRINDLFGRKS